MFKTRPHPERGGGEGEGRKETIRLKSVELQVHAHDIAVKDKNEF